jgi:protein N-terminal amidase
MHRIIARQIALEIVLLTALDSPYRFEAPWHAFEFGFHIIEVQADLVIINMAWLTREEGRTFSRMPSEVSLSDVSNLLP